MTETTNERTGHLTPLFLVRLHMFTCDLFPRREDVKSDPLLGVIPERWRGNHLKREDGVSVDANEVARHAHGKRFTGARPESEPVASDEIEQEEPSWNWAIISLAGWSRTNFNYQGWRGSSLKGRASTRRCRQVTSASGRESRPDTCALQPETGSVNGLRPADATGLFRTGTVPTAGGPP